VLAIIALGVFATVRRMSTATSDQLDVTADGVLDPQVLRRHFSGNDGSGGEGDSGTGEQTSGY
jgi:hypothetical protein